MAAWDDRDLNNPELYKPRSYPKVKPAVQRIHNADGEFEPPPVFSKAMGTHAQNAYAESNFEYAVDDSAVNGDRFSIPAASNEPDTWFDEDLAWSRSLSDVPVTVTTPKPSPRSRGSEAFGANQPSIRQAGKRSAMSPAKRTGPGKGRRGGSPDGSDRKGLFASPFLYVGIITLCTFALAFIVVMMMPQVAGYFWKDVGNYAFINGEVLRYDQQIADNYKRYKAYLQEDIIYPGVFIDNIHVGGLGIQEARDALTGADVQASALFSVNVAIGNKTWTFNSANVPATRDLGNVLEQAYAIGRTNTTSILGTQMTPFRERVSTAVQLREAGVNLTARPSYDHETVRKLVGEIEAYVTREPVDAALKSIDTNTHTLLFTDEQVGVTIDGEALYQKVTDALDNWEKDTTITVEPVLTQPNVTKAQLTANFTRISAYTTDTTKDSNRNNNIDLACQAITSTALMPGEVFSFNTATGQRTTDKGYREAGAIAAGQSIEEVGGGICQVSSTLFNAVARADLEIVSRSPHAWPSTYVNRGEDATVNWPNLDFKFKNNRDTPVYVVAYYKGQKCSAEIWGFPLGEGISIDLQSTIVKTMEPPIDTLYVVNASLPFGTSKEIIKSRTGYVVDTYKVWYQNSKEIKREKMHTSTYKAFQRTIEYN